MVIYMDKVYDFNWIAQEIDNCLVLKLCNSKKAIGIYQASEILSIDLDDVNVKFANALDLMNFVNHSVIRFRHITNPENIIDIPLRNVYKLFLNSNELATINEKYLRLNKLEAFMVRDGEVKNDNYLVYVYKVNEESEELKKTLKIAYEYNNLGMQEKIEALEQINLINYHRENDKSERRI